MNPKAKNGITPKRIAERAGQIHCVALIDRLTTKCAHFRSQCDTGGIEVHRLSISGILFERAPKSGLGSSLSRL
jgi:hypothetical protein